MLLLPSTSSRLTLAPPAFYFHAIVADLFRQLPPQVQSTKLQRTFDTPRSRPRAIYAASINQLKRLLLIFRTSFEQASLSLLSQTVLVYVCNAVIREAQNSDQVEWRFYLRLCLAAEEDLYGSYRESWFVTRAILSMALERNAVTVSEAKGVLQELLELGRHHNKRGDESNTRSIIDLDLAYTNSAAARVETYAGKFDELVLERTADY